MPLLITDAFILELRSSLKRSKSKVKSALSNKSLTVLYRELPLCHMCMVRMRITAEPCLWVGIEYAYPILFTVKHRNSTHTDMETPSWCREGHQPWRPHNNKNIWHQGLLLKRKLISPESQHIESNDSSRAVWKTLSDSSSFNPRQRRHFNVTQRVNLEIQTWNKFKRGTLSRKLKLEELVIFDFGKRWRQMKPAIGNNLKETPPPPNKLD